MKKFDSISVSDYRPNLMSANLNGLGRINVLCGKNNSGKSTLLNALNELSKGDIHHTDSIRVMSRTSLVIKTKRTQVSKSDFDLSIVPEVDNALNQNNKPSEIIRKRFSRDFIFEKLFECLDEFILLEPSFDKDIFIEKFQKFLDKDYEYDFFEPTPNLPLGIINQLVDQFLPSRKSIRLIPTSRYIPNNVKLRGFKNYDPGGERIVNLISHYKNQLPGSKEYLKFAELQRAFTEISEGLKFEVITTDDLELEVLFSNKEGFWVNAENSGLGLRDLLSILFEIVLPDYDILLIEEPERHLHSSTQRRLLMYLSNQNKQFFIATHSNVFLDLDYVDTIFITEYINGQITVKNESSKARALMELGYSVADNLVSDLVILTEGPSDRVIIEHFLFELGILQSKIVRFWPLGGDIMNKLDLSILKDSYHIIALIDDDPGSSPIRTTFNAKCTELGIDCHRLQRYSIENYITLEALRKQFSSQIPSSLTSIDHNIKLQDQIDLNVKKTLNRVVKHMTFSDIEDTDLGAFILKVKRLLE